MSDVIQWILLRNFGTGAEATRCQELLDKAGIDSQAFYEDGMPVYPGPQGREGTVEVRVERWNITKAKDALKAAGIAAAESESE
jgi:hypothetical protein